MELRQRYPDWGARKLQALLQRGDGAARITVHRVLLRQDLVRAEDRHPPAVQRFERARPNELWQMDFKSPKGWNAPVGPLSVMDDHSRYVIALQQTGSTQRELVREQLQSAFHQLRGAGGDADGSWHAVVECDGGHGGDGAEPYG